MTAESSLVTVVITTRNRLSLLQEAVASVLTQSHESIELMVVDDASHDGTWAWLEGGRNDRLRPIRLVEHSERSKARNRGLADARGDFVMFLDDDDLLRPRTVERFVRLLSLDSEAVAVVGARWKFEEWGDAARIPHTRRLAKRVIWPELLSGCWSANSGQMLYRTAVVRRAGGYPEGLHRAEDRDLWLRVARTGPVLLDPSVAYEQRIHSGRNLPPDVHELREGVYSRFIERLSAAERPRAERIRSAGRASARAEEAFYAQRYGEAVVEELRAFRTAPFLYRSPLIGPPRFLRLARSVRRLLGGPRPSGRTVER